MTEVEKLRLELVELKLENLIAVRSDWASMELIEKNYKRIKEIEQILKSFEIING